jgi:hypothetical protein
VEPLAAVLIRTLQDLQIFEPLVVRVETLLVVSQERQERHSKAEVAVAPAVRLAHL